MLVSRKEGWTVKLIDFGIARSYFQFDGEAGRE